jgi:hypothetical protein
MPLPDFGVRNVAAMRFFRRYVEAFDPGDKAGFVVAAAADSDGAPLSDRDPLAEGIRPRPPHAAVASRYHHLRYHTRACRCLRSAPPPPARDRQAADWLARSFYRNRAGAFGSGSGTPPGDSAGEPEMPEICAEDRLDHGRKITGATRKPEPPGAVPKGAAPSARTFRDRGRAQRFNFACRRVVPGGAIPVQI